MVWGALLIVFYLQVIVILYMRRIDRRFDTVEDMLVAAAGAGRGPLEDQEQYGPPNVWMILSDREDQNNVVPMPPPRRFWPVHDGGPGSAA